MDWPGPRFTSIAVLLCVGLWSGALQAQEPLPPVPSCIVIGDVQQPDAYPIVSDRVVTVGDMTRAAGLTCESSFVTVLRAGSRRSQMTELVHRRDFGSSTPVQAGDVIIVRGSVAADRPGIRNAAIVSDFGQLVITLATSSIRLGDIITELQLDLPPGFTVVRTTISGVPQGPPLQPHEIVRHGDILRLTSVGSVESTPGRGPQHRMTQNGIDVSSFPVESSAGTFPHGTDASGTAQTRTAQMSSVQHDGPPWLTVPSGQTNEQTAAAQDSVTAVVSDDVFLPSAAAAASPASAGFSSQIGIPPATESDQVGPINGNPASDAVNADNELPANQQLPAATSSPSLAAGDAGAGVLNTVFVGGLLLAGSLIIAGWIRSEIAASRAMASAATPTSFEVPRMSKSAAAGDASVDAGDSDRRPDTSEAATQVKRAPSRPARDDAIRPKTDHSQTIVITTSSVSSDSATRQPEAAATVSPGRLVDDAEWYSDWRQRSAALKSNSVTTVGDSDVTAATADMRSAARQQPLDDLDALIQNQLPMEFCAAPLPTRITLYGRPAGPRRLRIDAAHPRVPAPHFNTARAAREEESATPAADTTATVPAESQRQGRAGGNSLDRALNYLDGRVKP